MGETSCLLDKVAELGAMDAPSLRDIAAVLGGGDITDDRLDEVLLVDDRRPYGRQVLLATPKVEGMIARWTRAHPCAPHDHGGSSGGVRVLRGRARHRMWRVVDGRLELAAEEVREAGDVLVCGPDLVHSMGDDGADEPLVTLHLYTGPIEHMVVYDVPTRRTYVVDGGCGAWVPVDEPDLVRCWYSGFLRHPPLLAEAHAPCPQVSSSSPC